MFLLADTRKGKRKNNFRNLVNLNLYGAQQKYVLVFFAPVVGAQGRGLDWEASDAI